MKTIIFVCYGNIQRSVIAEFYLRKVLRSMEYECVEVLSRGLMGTLNLPMPSFDNLTGYHDQWEASRKTLESLALDISSHMATPITINDVESADLVIAMSEDILHGRPESLESQFPKHKEKMMVFPSKDSQGIPDHGDISDETKVQRMITELVESIDSNLKLFM